MTNPVITAPASATVTEGQPTAISGVSISDQGAATFNLTIEDTYGLLNVTPGAGEMISGRGSNDLTISGTIDQVNADLATLTDTDPATENDTIDFNGFDEYSSYSAPAAISVSVACYLRGTGIATPGGERAIEALAIGDSVLTASGTAEKVSWIGRRAYKARFVRANPDVAPVRITAGAIADGVPSRDLSVSPHHAMLIDGVLVEAVDLVNSVTILPTSPTDEVEYFHVELASHAVLLANGAPSESFVDDDSRMMFHNAYDYFATYPEAERRPATFCAPRVSAGPALDAIRRGIAARIVQVVLNRAA